MPINTLTSKKNSPHILCGYILDSKEHVEKKHEAMDFPTISDVIVSVNHLMVMNAPASPQADNQDWHKGK